MSAGSGSATTGWLIDKSALARLSGSPDSERWFERIERGLVRIATVTVLEVGYSARTSSGWRELVDGVPVRRMPIENLTPRSERRAIAVQGLLAARGEHRAPSVPDLLIAASAELAGLTVLHVDKDFDLVAEVTRQPMERLLL